MSSLLVTINIVVHNGEKYIRQCLDSVLVQNYPHELIEVNILDNASTDSTLHEIEKVTGPLAKSTKTKYFDTMIYQSTLKTMTRVKLFKSAENLGMWPGQEELLKYSHGEYIIVLSVDVILHPDFIKNAVEIMEQDLKIGAIQAQVYKYELSQLPTTNGSTIPSSPSKDYRRFGSPELTNEGPSTAIIDTLGFKIYRSRRIINIGHGEIDHGQYDKNISYLVASSAQSSGRQMKATQNTAKICLKQIFAVEGAVPVFRCQALEDCRLESQGPLQQDPTLHKVGSCEKALEDCQPSSQGISPTSGKIIDPDYFWYGDDLDLAWRMRIFGWKQVYAPNIIAWHDRKTTKALASGWQSFIKIRKTVPMLKRRLDWRNTTFTIIKNDFTANILRDLPFILWRQLRLWAYFMLFEPVMVLEIFKVARMLPKMLKRRREIIQKAKISAKELHQWIHP